MNFAHGRDSCSRIGTTSDHQKTKKVLASGGSLLQKDQNINIELEERSKTNVCFDGEKSCFENIYFCSSMSRSSRSGDSQSIISLSCGSTGECEDLLNHEDVLDKEQDGQKELTIEGYSNQSYETMAIISSSSFSSEIDQDDMLESEEKIWSVASSPTEFISLPKTISFLSRTSEGQKQILNGANTNRDHQPVSISCCESVGASFSDLPNELIWGVASYLDISSLSHFRCVSKNLLVLLSQDEAGWANHCRMLWREKVHVCSLANTMLQNKNAMKAYHLSSRDGKNRHEITELELCFDPLTGKGTRWSFRFKQAAGSDWTSWDPWWNGGETRKMVFLRDGTVKQVVDTFKQNLPGPSNRSFVLQDAFFDTRSETPTLNPDIARVSPAHQIMKWRLVSQPMDLPLRPHGAYIRLTLGGRDVPTYIIHRSPTGNWGFVMESCWGVFSSFDLPARQNHELLNSRHNGNPRMRLRRTQEGGRWIDVHGVESDSEDEQEINQVAANRSLLDDSAFSVTNCWQWREALLYNYGAMSLPEGEGATVEFDRIWTEAIRPGQVNTSPSAEESMHNYMDTAARAQAN